MDQRSVQRFISSHCGLHTGALWPTCRNFDVVHRPRRRLLPDNNRTHGLVRHRLHDRPCNRACHCSLRFLHFAWRTEIVVRETAGGVKGRRVSLMIARGIYGYEVSTTSRSRVDHCSPLPCPSSEKGSLFRVLRIISWIVFAGN